MATSRPANTANRAPHEERGDYCRGAAAKCVNCQHLGGGRLPWPEAGISATHCGNNTSVGDFRRLKSAERQPFVIETSGQGSAILYHGWHRRLPTPTNRPCRQTDDCTQELEHAIDHDADEAEREQEKPDDRDRRRAPAVPAASTRRAESARSETSPYSPIRWSRLRVPCP